MVQGLRPLFENLALALADGNSVVELRDRNVDILCERKDVQVMRLVEDTWMAWAR
jgi:hypothetical protein